MTKTGFVSNSMSQNWQISIKQFGSNNRTLIKSDGFEL